jgi:UDP-N-acetylmuramoyl-tripeptide--D-alanyl-D-alanine ligase
VISLRFDQLAAATGGTLYNTDVAGRSFTGVSIDTRSLKPGELFIAIKGPRRDGHDYIPRAIENGAAGILAEMTFSGVGRIRGDVPVVGVRDTHRTMIALAERMRDEFSGRIAAITGSEPSSPMSTAPLAISTTSMECRWPFLPCRRARASPSWSSASRPVAR